MTISQRYSFYIKSFILSEGLFNSTAHHRRRRTSIEVILHRSAGNAVEILRRHGSTAIESNQISCAARTARHIAIDFMANGFDSVARFDARD